MRSKINLAADSTAKTFLATLEERSTESPPIPLRMTDIVSFGGMPTDSGVLVTPRNALQVSTVLACCRAIAEDLAGTLKPVFQRTANGRVQQQSHPVYRCVNRQPNELQTAIIFWQVMLFHVLLHGDGYAWIDRSGSIPQLYILDPTVTRACLEKGTYFYRSIVGGKSVELDPADVLHIIGLSMDGLNGISPIREAARNVGVAIALEKFAAQFFGNNAQLGLILKSPKKISDIQYQNLKDSFTNRAAFKLAILEEGLDAASLGVPPEQGQFLESRNYQVTDILRIFRVPPHKAGQLDKATFSNIEHQSIEYVRDTLRSYAIRIEQEINRKLFTTAEQDEFYCEVDLDSLMRGDTASQDASFAARINMGVYSVNQVCEKLNEPPVVGGDEHYRPLNMGVVGQPTTQQPDIVPARNYRPIVEDAARRVITKEVNALDRAAKKHEGDPSGLKSWAMEFLTGHEAIIRQSFLPVMQLTHPENVQSQLNTIVARHIQTSMTELLAAIDNGQVGELIVRWGEKRADDVADEVLGGT